MLVVPGQDTRVRTLTFLVRSRYPLTMKGIIVPAVLELFPYPPADFEVKVGRNGHIAGVEQAMDVATQEEPVGRLVIATDTVGADMSGLQGRQRPLLRHCAAATIDIRHENAEGPLPQAWLDELRLSDSERAMLMGGACAKAYRWSPTNG
jgi:hypothetical protein